ncbi:MAG: thermonuclease family protein [Phenylobacterium sp.]|uniref:thermonuclease family protein n=1 Tax=Phenylobacterium sp. TaxID=1871053 RepID=UPI00271A4026|nr:thermonuclease family protein [Phenylobacterium sp.]MDO8410967.1 thermonuclease family protein [Phenylobacterium sp.]
MIRRLGVLVLAAGLAAASPAEFTGPARVVDGDTFSIGAERVRLWGVDAPEGRQVCQDAKGQRYACGDAARDQLVGLIGGRIVRCEIRDRDPYGRAASRCQAGSTDLGGAMVRAGWAVDYAQFSRGAYASAEAEARRARRGLWAGRFETPSTWRADERQARPAPVAPPQAGCVIKGNINAQGRRIFHVPGQQDYAATRIDTARGERWFCSAAEARAVGWTAAAR